ncbi:hypothetical protein D9M68_795720 [compost metagenome]
MGVGHDQTIGAQDEAGTYPARLCILRRSPLLSGCARRHAGRHRNAETLEEFEHLFVGRTSSARANSCGALQCADIDHGWTDQIDQIGEVRQASHTRRRRHGNHRLR